MTSAIDLANAVSVVAPRWTLDHTVEIASLVFERYRMPGGPTLILNADPWAGAFACDAWYAAPREEGDPRRLAALATLAFELARPHPGDPELRELEALGARVRSGASADFAFIGVSGAGRDTLAACVDAAARRHEKAQASRLEQAKDASHKTLRALRPQTVEHELHEALAGNLFAPETAAAIHGVPAIARQVAIATLTSTEAVDFAREMFAPHNALIIAAGDVDRAWLLQQVRERLGVRARTTAPRDATRAATTSSTALSTPAARIELALSTSSPYVLLGWALPPTGAVDPTFDALALHLGTLDLTSRVERFRGGGAFALLTRVEEGTTATAAAARVVRTIAAIEPPPLEREASIRMALESNLLRDLDDLAARAFTLARAELIGIGIEGLAQRLELARTIDASQIANAAREALARRPPVVVITRPP